MRIKLEWTENDERAFREYKQKQLKEREREARKEKREVEAVLRFINSTWKGSNGWN